MSSRLARLIESRIVYILRKYNHLLNSNEIDRLNGILRELRSGEVGREELRSVEKELSDLMERIRKRQLEDMNCDGLHDAKRTAKKHAKKALSKLEKVKRDTVGVDHGLLRLIFGSEYYRLLFNYDRFKLKTDKIDRTNKIEDCYDVYITSTKIINGIDENIIKNIKNNKEILNVLFKIYLMASNARMSALSKLHSFNADDNTNDVISKSFKIECDSLKFINNVVETGKPPHLSKVAKYLRDVLYLNDTVDINYVITTTDFNVKPFYNEYYPPVSRSYNIINDTINDLFGNKLYKFPYWVVCAELIVASMLNYNNANASCAILPVISTSDYYNYDYVNVSSSTNKICYRDGNTFYSKGANVTLDDLLNHGYASMSRFTLWLFTFSGVVRVYQYNLAMMLLSESSNVLDMKLYFLDDMINGVKMLDLSSSYVINTYYSIFAYLLSTLDLNDVSLYKHYIQINGNTMLVELNIDYNISTTVNLLSSYRIFLDSLYLILSNEI